MTEVLTVPVRLSAPAMPAVRAVGRPVLLPHEWPVAKPRTIGPSRARVFASTFGPAFVAAIAYVDPGNFATNFQSGAAFGYRLMWVVLAANLMALPVQYLSAKLGIVTGKSLPQLCRETMPRYASWLMWAQAEIVAMATDLAEFIGAAIGLNLLFHVPLPEAGFITAILAFGICSLQQRGFRAFELAIGGLLALVSVGFAYETLRIGPSARASLGGLVPSLAGHDSVLLAVGIVGATVMPHAIYMHSGLTSLRTHEEKPSTRTRLLRMQKLDVGLALGVAGLVNLSMLAVAAKVFHHVGAPSDPSISDIHAGLGSAVGGGAALAFAAALLASGISSSSVGSCAGQIIMTGFIKHSMPPLLRRGITMLPAIVLLCFNLNPTQALVMSQVVLSFGIPFAIIPLVILTGRRSVMGSDINKRGMKVTMTGITAMLTALNVYLIAQAVV